MWSVALKAPNGRRVQWMESEKTGEWQQSDEGGAALTIDTWAHRTLLAEDWDGWIMYNDEPPKQKPIGTCGHCKGVVVWNAQKAGWLIHSVPLWPPAFEEQLDGREMMDNIGDDQVKFGQSFAWLDIPRADLAAVLQHVSIMQPQVYVVCDTEGLWKPSKSKGGQIAWLELGEGVRHVAKNRQWGKCLFKEGLNAELGGPCIAETWCRPKPTPTSDVWNAIVLGWPESKPMVAYHESQDHSKYAVSQPPAKAWTYVGDINNMKSQWKRGGGGLVLEDAGVHAAFQSLIHTDDRPA